LSAARAPRRCRAGTREAASSQQAKSIPCVPAPVEGPQGDAVCAKQDLEALAKEQDVKHPGAVNSLREGLEQTLTVLKLGLPALLRRGLRTTNAMEALTARRRATVRRVSRFTTGGQALRWAAVAALRVEPRLYHVAGYSQLPILAQAERREPAARRGGPPGFSGTGC